MLVAVIAGAALTRRARHRVRLRIATGQPGGTFLPLGEILAGAFKADVPGVAPEVLPSPGSDASVAMLERGDVELALVSSNSSPGSRVSLIAPLYGELLQIVVRRAAGIRTVEDLAGKRVSLGLRGSGTETIANQVLSHFGVARSSLSAENMSPLDATARLEAGTLDAAFIVVGLRAPVVSRLMARPDMDLLALGDPDKQGNAIEGISIDAPYLRQAVIPERAYGAVPRQPVGTVGVKALLVARKDLDEDLVYELSESLFAAKVRLAERERLLARLTEKFDPTESPFPLHPGADRYLRREEPSLISKYTDQISLAFTVAAVLWSAVAALRAWRRNAQRGRIEAYFDRLSALTSRARAATTDEERAAVRAEACALEAEALRELAAERLEAGPAFRVLQEGLRTLFVYRQRHAG